MSEREEHSHFYVLVRQLQLHDREYFFKFLRMSPNRLEHLLKLVAPFIQKKKCRSRRPLYSAERLVITLRYLATGDSQQSQAFNFRIGKSTACYVVKETCEAIWTALREIYLKAPSCADDWKQIGDSMFSTWDFPNCIGALDGKHIAIECPPNSGSNYYNYKKFYSLVLMALCDARYCFTLVDIGNYGRENDCQIFNRSVMGKAFIDNHIDMPPPSLVNGHMLPYAIVSDEIFALKPWLMKPYGAKALPVSEEIFNYRLSRCRRTIENSFGILTARWRIFQGPIKAKPETVDSITKACICLHNYLRLTTNAQYLPSGFVDNEDSKGNIIPGDWRTEKRSSGALLSISTGTAHNRSSQDAYEVRKAFKEYFISENGALPWQRNYVT